MELVHEACKASNFAPPEYDVISSMPDDVITNILDRLPIQDAVKTSILSRNWISKWTMLNGLVFDEKFVKYLIETRNEKDYGRIISKLLLHLKGSITKFFLYIEEECYFLLDDADINNWVMILSRKGIKEFTLINMGITILKLPAHLFSCVELKHLKLHKCSFCPPPSFSGYPNLLSLHLYRVTSESYRYGEFLIRSPLLENLKINYYCDIGEILHVDIAQLINLKVLYLPLFDLTSYDFRQLMSSFQKLRELTLDFYNSEFLPDARKNVQTTLPCLKTLNLFRIDISSSFLLSVAIKFICGSPNLQKLKITADYNDGVFPPALDSLEVDCSRMGQLQLQIVVFEYIRGSENEVCVIKSLLASSPYLKKMVIRPKSSEVQGGDSGQKIFTEKLFKLPRASPIAKINIIWI